MVHFDFKIKGGIMSSSIDLSELICIWDRLNVMYTGDIDYSDFEKAVEEVVYVENDLPIIAWPPAT